MIQFAQEREPRVEQTVCELPRQDRERATALTMRTEEIWAASARPQVPTTTDPRCGSR